MFTQNGIAQFVVGGDPQDSGRSFRRPRAWPGDAQPDLSRSTFGADQSASTPKAVSAVDERVAPSKVAREVNWRYVGTVSLLNAAIAAGVAATVAAHGVVLGVVLPNVILTAPRWLLIYGATVIGTGVLARFGLGQFLTHKTVERAGRTTENAIAHDRVTESLKRLSEKLQSPIDLHVSIRKKDPGLAYLIDRLFTWDVLGLSEDLVSKLTDPELDALVAHEVCHSNRSFSKFQYARILLHCFSSPAIFWGTALPVYSSLSQSCGGLLAGGAAVLASSAVWIAAMCSFMLTTNFVSRKNECKTDLRAVKLTDEPGAYLSMLQKALQLPKSNSEIKLPTVLSTHPPGEQRLQAVVRVFGGAR